MPSTVSHFARALPRHALLPSFATEAPRLKRFAPPFRFTSFFAPEETLLAVVAAEAALARVRAARGEADDDGDEGDDGGSPVEAAEGATRIVDLTAGSGLVGLRLLDLDRRATLLGLDVDPNSPGVARANAEQLGLEGRARFERASLWDGALARALCAGVLGGGADLVTSNPPCVPAPPGGGLPAEVGAGAEGASHLRRALALSAEARPAAIALSWSSLADPRGIVAYAERVGYRLAELFVIAVGDGEQSGGAHRYLRALPTAFLSEAPDVVAAVAPDGAARFAYLLMAGVFVPRAASETLLEAATAPASAAPVVEHLVRDFVARGADALVAPAAPFPVTAWLLDRWDEIALRVFLHGAL